MEPLHVKKETTVPKFFHHGERCHAATCQVPLVYICASVCWDNMVIKNYLPSPIGQKKFKDNDLQLEIYTTKTWTCMVTSSYV